MSLFNEVDMVRKDIYVDKFDWTIHTFFAISDVSIDEVMDILWEMDCNALDAQRAYDNMTSGKMNVGFCYTNAAKHESIIVISPTSSAEEFFNSFLHEMCHLQSHICSELNLSPMGEEIAYFMGNLAHELYPYVKHLLCECCRHKYIE